MKNLFAHLGVASVRSRIMPALIAVLTLMPAGRVTAQTFSVLHTFAGGGDGFVPTAGLITNSSGNTLYGTAHEGGISGNGTVFAVNTDGTGFTNLHSFTGGSDGGPRAGLVLSGNTLYGTAPYAGSAGFGTVFAVNTDGTGFTNLYSFTGGSDGAVPVAGLILSGNSLFGTAQAGGYPDNGTVFAVNTDGTGFTNLHSFQELSDIDTGTNSDGAIPQAGLILSGNTLYGTANGGGSAGYGTIFAVNTDGTGFTNLHSFNFQSDGALPNAGLILSGNTLYGTAPNGGAFGGGTVFAVHTNGTGFTTLHRFTENFFPYTNSDGTSPYAGLILRGNTLYGTAIQGGSSGNGTVFAVNTDGTGFTNLYRFTARSTNSSGVFYTNSDGAAPYAGLILSGNTLYGTATYGGSSGNGTVFSLSFRPQLSIAASGTNVILSWPLSYAGFSYAGYFLQDTENLLPQANWIRTADTNLPVIINGQISVTRPMLGPQWSYRLAQ